MIFPERFSNLPTYAFPRLRELLDAHAPGGDVVHMTIGEPQHDFPAFVPEIIARHVAEFRRYPDNNGIPELLSAITGWIARRYGVTLPSSQVMALNGTREGLYNAAMALCPEQKAGAKPLVLMPNPFYQVYAVAALSVAAEPLYVAATEASGFVPDYAALPEAVLQRTAIAYICSPANPQGTVASRDYWRDLLALAEKYDFQIFADECYSEIYRDAAPIGILTVAAETGADPERVVLFNSLSKRSNLAGLRSGLVAGGPKSIARIRQLRAFSGAPLPKPLQYVAAAAWADEDHVVENRRLYAGKFDIADEIFAGVPGYTSPPAGFFLWLPVKDGEQAAVRLWTETGVRVLPGAYLSRDVNGENPGKNYIRVALVAPIKETQRALIQIRDCLYVRGE